MSKPSRSERRSKSKIVCPETTGYGQSPVNAVNDGSVAISGPVGVYKTDTNGSCVWVNEIWTELTGLSLEAALGEGWQRAIHPDDFDRLIKEWSGLPKGGSVFCSEYRYLRPDGTVRWVLGRAVEEFDIAGKLVGFAGVCVDISELRQGPRRGESYVTAIVEKEPTARELEVAKLLADGFSNKSIAQKLGISPRTVEAHRARLMRKLRVKSLAGLIRYAIARGLVK